jgi:predicted nucleic acid-binding protein
MTRAVYDCMVFLQAAARSTGPAAACLEAVRDVEVRAVALTEVPRDFVLARDPKDEPYLTHAIASEANYLVTWDRDLLDLRGDEGFRQRFPTLTILDPPIFLRELGAE